MKIKEITFCLIFVSIILSCKKEDIGIVGDPGSPANSYVAKLSKVLTDNQSTKEYSYNDSNVVTLEKSKFDYIINHYNSKGLLTTTQYYGNDAILSSDPQVAQAALISDVWVTPSNGKIDGTINYEYDANSKLIKSTYCRPSSTSSEYSQFAYSNNRISRQTMYWENAVTGYIDYSYDSKGNLISETLYNIPASGTAEIISNIQYAYDNQFNPFRTISGLMTPGIKTNQNNIVKEIYTIHMSVGQGADNVQTTVNTYDYNAMGYPVTKNGNVSFEYK
jgi:hypothetical protein